jgi:hypothetical protein
MGSVLIGLGDSGLDMTGIKACGAIVFRITLVEDRLRDGGLAGDSEAYSALYLEVWGVD